MLNLDPALLDQDKIRFKKRKHLLLAYVVPVTILLVAAVFFARVGIYNIFLSLESRSHTYGVTPTLNDFQKSTNILEPYIAHYNDGYIKMAKAETAQDLDDAINSFKESLKNNPPEDRLCSIYGNISYALEIQADQKVAVKNYDTALVLFNRAEAALYENDCATKDSSIHPAKDSKSEDAKERIESKRRKAIAAANNMVDDDEEMGPANQQIDDEKINEILNRQQVVNDMGNFYLRLNQTRSGGMPYIGLGEPRF